MADDELSRQNKKIVSEMYAAAARGDLEAFTAPMSDETFVLHEPSFLPYGGSYETKQGMLDGLAKIGEYLDVGALQVERIIADGNHVFGVLRAPDRATGDLVHLAEESTLRDGKIVEMRIYIHEGQTLVKR